MEMGWLDAGGLAQGIIRTGTHGFHDFLQGQPKEDYTGPSPPFSGMLSASLGPARPSEGHTPQSANVKHQTNPTSACALKLSRSYHPFCHGSSLRGSGPSGGILCRAREADPSEEPAALLLSFPGPGGLVSCSFLPFHSGCQESTKAWSPSLASEATVLTF